MHIELDQVILRRPEPKDAEVLYRYRNDWDVIQSLGGFSTGYSMKDIQEWIEYHRSRTDEIIWSIVDNAEDRCLGHVGLYRIDHRVRSAEFAIMIGDKQWWGRGIGKEVTRAVIEYGFTQLNLHRVSLSALNNNARAIAIYKKLDFKVEGVLRDEQFRDGQYLDVVLMGLLEQEWRGR